MKKWIISLSLAAGVISLTACNNGNNNADNSAAVAETKAGDISKDQLYAAMKEKYGQAALQELIYEKVLSDKYKVTDEELDKKVDDLKAQLGSNFEQALQQYGYKDEEDLRETFKIGLLQEKAAVKDVKVTDKEVKEYYDNYKPEIKARHILVADEKTAKEVKQKLDKGEKFEDLAKKYSTDTGSAQKGGDLGWFGSGKMVPAFEEAAYKLDVNQISDPVKSDYGYHIIQVTDKKEKEPFEKVKKDMEYDLKVSKLDETAIQKAMTREINDAKVKINDKDLKGLMDTLTQSPSTGQ